MPSHSINRAADWKRVRERGRSGRAGEIRVMVAARCRPDLPSRLGLRVRVAGPARAVRRNRARRRLREAWRLTAPPGLDVVVQADGSYADRDFQEVVTDLRTALGRAGAEVRR